MEIQLDLSAQDIAFKNNLIDE